MIRFVARGWERVLDDRPAALRPRERGLRRLFRRLRKPEDELRRLWARRS